jgi:DNA-binding SARP family transcriptional activator
MLRVQLLGPVEAFADESQLPLGGTKQRTVLAVLANDPGRPVSVDRLIEAVWGDEVPDRASRSISTFVSNLRGVLGDVITRDGPGYVAHLDRREVDATDFADRVGLARQRFVAEPGEAATEIRDALELWIGQPFQGVDGHPVLEPEVSRLTELRITAIEAVIDAELAVGDVDLNQLDHLVAEYPLREHIRGLQMRALCAVGRQAEALTSYKALRDQLATDMGLDPSPELKILH